MNYFVTGIGTNVGKTVVSAVLTEALQADYWKPIQSGTIEGKDSETVKALISNTKTVIHPETYLLKEPLSPHLAAKLENVTIDIDKINLPAWQHGGEANRHLIIEGAGGLLVPINNTYYVIDIAKKTHCEIIVVISNYLGCINHSLLTIDYLLRNQFKIKALVFNGEFDEDVRKPIQDYLPSVIHLDIPTLQNLSRQAVSEISAKIRSRIA
ncbi:MAG: dethiobiotin synthase [Bacteroidetes bacterium]|nr:dethiobiotin synthase [Bacteroidota bacterium]